MAIPLPVVAAAVALIVILLALLLRRGPAARDDLTEAPQTVALPPVLEGDVRALLDAGDKIGAIKLVREQTGLDLKEAKDQVERLERQR